MPMLAFASRFAGAQTAVQTGSVPVTVADLIALTTIGNRVQGYGYYEDYNVVSPNGAHVAVVVQRGNVAHNTRDYTLLVFRTADLLHHPKPDTIVRFATSSNRPAIGRIRWLADNATLVLLGEQPGELPQVYTVDTRTKKCMRQTHATAVITAFGVAANGNVIVYATEELHDTTSYPAMRAHGFVVPQRALVSEVIAGEWGYREPTWASRSPHKLHVVREGVEWAIPLPDSAAGYRRCDLFARGMTVAPSGDAAIVQCVPTAVPAPWWARYQQAFFRQLSNAGEISAVYVVVDLHTARIHRLLDAPAHWSSTLAWAPNSRSVVLANAMLPLDVLDSSERTAREMHNMVAEIDIRTGTTVVIAQQDSLNIVTWDPRHDIVELAPGGFLGSSERRRLYYRKTNRGWNALSAAQIQTVAPVPALVVDQGMNRPWQLVAIDPRTKVRHVVVDPNPGLMGAYRFGHEDVLRWQTKGGAKWVAGLYWPVDYVRGKRYPLVIQTHGFDSTYFWPDGSYTTGAAAQPLAGRGVMVLQMDRPPADQVLMTPREGPFAEEGTEAAIDYLDSLGLIDRKKVGMQGFSRTCFYILYFLTHSHYPLAAATVTDGVDLSYLQYVLTQPTFAGLGWDEDVQMNGGPPWGPSLATWRERAPGFNLDRVTAPLQLTALGIGSLLGEWEPYAGLVLQGKPAELVYIPDGEHVLVKPWERMTSQQGAVDWFLFWLKGEEDPDPAKAEQYARWHHLRAQRDSTEAKTANATKSAEAR